MQVFRITAIAGAIAAAGMMFSAASGTAVAAVSTLTATDAVAPVSTIEHARMHRRHMMRRNYRGSYGGGFYRGNSRGSGANPAGTMTRSNRDGIKHSGGDK
jgi:hypothetical protein